VLIGPTAKGGTVEVQCRDSAPCLLAGIGLARRRFAWLRGRLGSGTAIAGRHCVVSAEIRSRSARPLAVAIQSTQAAGSALCIAEKTYGSAAAAGNTGGKRSE